MCLLITATSTVVAYCCCSPPAAACSCLLLLELLGCCMEFSYFSHSFMDEVGASSSNNTSTSSSHPTQYVGVVSSKRTSFGFIRSQLPTDTFFHKSACAELFDSLNPGDAVCFQLQAPNSSQPGKRVAASVTRSTQPPELEAVDPTQQYGRIMKLPSLSSAQAAGVLRSIPAAGQVQHLTFTPSDVVLAGQDAQELLPGQPVTFKVLTDKRKQLLVEAAGHSASPNAVHAYKRAVQVTPIPSGAMVSAAAIKSGFEQPLHRAACMQKCSQHLQDLHSWWCSVCHVAARLIFTA